ncbi:hypothetical protein GCM10023346_04910 [Arthrobacter gyeryongensis]|uniref:Uncharacterized protein n=1 Tax=Arthrobacter gyeryongensis TaxID=1650592 RepID=A0ABP9S2J1_9MICC
MPRGRILPHSHDGLRRLAYFRKSPRNRKNLAFLANEPEPEARAVPKDFKLSSHFEGLSLELRQRPQPAFVPRGFLTEIAAAPFLVNFPSKVLLYKEYNC